MESISRVNALIIERNRDLFPGELRRLEMILVFRRRITSSGLFFQAQISTKIWTTSALLALKHNANVGIDLYKDLKIIVMVFYRFCPIFWLNLLEANCFFNFPRRSQVAFYKFLQYSKIKLASFTCLDIDNKLKPFLRSYCYSF